METVMVRKPKPPKPSPVKDRISNIKFLTTDELKRLISAIKDKRDKAIFLTSYRHGLRASEVGLLQITDVDFKGLRITIHRVKGSRSGTYPMQPDEARILKSYVRSRTDSSSYLFLSNRGTPIQRVMLHYLMKHYGDLAKLPDEKQHFHALRHSIATPARRRAGLALCAGLAGTLQHSKHGDLYLFEQHHERTEGQSCVYEAAKVLIICDTITDISCLTPLSRV
jgi:integrase